MLADEPSEPTQGPGRILRHDGKKL